MFFSEKSLNDEIERVTKTNDTQKSEIVQLQFTNKMLKEELQKFIQVHSSSEDQKKSKQKRDKSKGKRTVKKKTGNI